MVSAYCTVRAPFERLRKKSKQFVKKRPYRRGDEKGGEANSGNNGRGDYYEKYVEMNVEIEKKREGRGGVGVR